MADREELKVNLPDAPSNTTKTINKVIIGALVLIAIGIGVVLTWAFQSSDVLIVNNSPFPTRTIRDHPTAGGVVILDADYCKKQDITGKMRTSFVSSSREVFLPLADERLEVGCKRQEVPIIIPKELPPDTYKIKFRATYDINPLKQNIPVEFESRPVEITAESTNKSQ
jgi:hypothetical protein